MDCPCSANAAREPWSLSRQPRQLQLWLQRQVKDWNLERLRQNRLARRNFRRRLLEQRAAATNSVYGSVSRSKSSSLQWLFKGLESGQMPAAAIAP